MHLLHRDKLLNHNTVVLGPNDASNICHEDGGIAGGSNGDVTSRFSGLSGRNVHFQANRFSRSALAHIRHNSDNLRSGTFGLSRNANAPADRIAVEKTAGEPVVDDRHGRTTFDVYGRVEHSAGNQRYSENPKEVGSHVI